MSAAASTPVSRSRQQHEPADRALTTLEVAVEQLDGERVGLLDRFEERAPLGVVRLAESALPEARVTWWNVQIAGLESEVVRRCVLVVREADRRIRAPSVDDRHSCPDVAQRHCEVKRVLPDLDRGPPALHAGPVPVAPHDLLDWILEARGHEHRSQACRQCPLGDARRAIRRAGGGERRECQHERAHRRRHRRDGRPVSHGQRLRDVARPGPRRGRESWPSRRRRR